MNYVKVLHDVDGTYFMEQTKLYRLLVYDS